MPDDIYLQLGIDSSKLKRDYIKNPLKRIIKKTGGIKYEKPYKEDLEYLYIILNLPREEISKIINIKERTIKRWLKYYNIKKDMKLCLNNIKKSCIKKYGVEYPFQSKIIKERIKQTCLERYGVESTNQLKEVKEKKKQTFLEKYGVENPSFRKEIIDKIHNTKKKNHTFNTSKLEEQIYELLKLKFKEVKRQYNEERYPYRCDFYIPEEDLFIEIQGNFTHGKEPYIGTKEQKKKVKLWESKNTEYYNNAINVWTIRDPLKRKTAKLNNLNWMEFFNIDEFMGWYNNQ